MTDSPLTSFVAAITMMGRERKALITAVATVSDFGTVLEDLAMLTTEDVVVGLRSKWVRRVAVPILHADRTLRGQAGTLAERAAIALEILGQITSHAPADVATRDRCIAWIKDVYLAPKETADAPAT